MSQTLTTKRLSMVAAITASAVALSAQAELVLEEVIVTAQKRVESLQEAPLSVVAYGENQLEARGLQSVVDITMTDPTVQAVDFPTSTSNIAIFMRGLGNPDSQTLTIDNPVGMYIDGVYMARTTGALIDVLDLERVEVLRGPQGTLYGRNSTAGAINFITKKPGDEFEGKIKAGVGNFGAYNLGGSVNMPVNDSLAVNVGVMKTARDGWVKNDGMNIVADQPTEDFAMKDQLSYRLALSWDATDNLNVFYSYDDADVDSTGGYYQRSIGKRVDETPMKFVLPAGNTQSSGHNLTLNYDINDSLSLKSITSYREMEERAVQNWSNTLTFATDIAWETEAFSQELQLNGTAFDESLKFVTGLYYFKEEGAKTENQYSNFYVSDDFQTKTFIAPDALALPKSSQGFTTLATGGTNLGIANFETELESVAIYGQATYDFSDSWSVTAGVRYSEDEREAVRSRDANNPALAFGSGANSLDYDRVDWNVSVDNQVSDNFNAYARVATGFRAGGSNERAINFSEGVFNEESAISYELGFKSELLENRMRLNAAIFQTDVEDYLLTVNATVPSKAAFVEIYNVGEATISGVEIDVIALLGENTQLTINHSYLDTELNDLVVPTTSLVGSPAFNIGGVDFRGQDVSSAKKLIMAPTHAVTVGWDHSVVRDFGSVDFNVNYAWRDGVYSNSNGFGVPALGLLNGRVAVSDLSAGDGNVSFAFWMKNITDKAKPVYNLNNFGYQYSTPRTFGIDATYRF